jgi:phage terminase large subunit-like protein
MNTPLTELTFSEMSDLIEAMLSKGSIRDIREAAEQSLFFFLVVVLRRPDAMHPWIYDRCNEVQKDPDGYLDLWPRFHYKSTIITFAQTIWNLAHNPELTFGIFSHTKEIARGFSKQIKREMETNPLLHKLWPDIFWKDPKREAIGKWSDDSGFSVKRKGNPKENSVESWGLTDGMPASRHYKILVYDDVVVKESVYTPEQIEKTTSAWELSYALGTSEAKKRYAGTRYHPADTYSVIIKRKSATPRIHYPTDDGTPAGNPVLMSKKALNECRITMGRNYSAQMFQAPTTEGTATFRESWLNWYTEHPAVKRMNVWILVDPAGGKEKRQRKNETSDFTVMEVWGLASDRNYYLLPGTFRDRLNLSERTSALFSLRRRYQKARVAYEEYGIQADIEHIQECQEREQYRFKITPVGGPMPKLQRIERLIPLFEESRIWLPRRLLYVSRADGQVHDFIQEFKDDEYIPCPIVPHDDMLDDAARLLDIPAEFPKDDEAVDQNDEYSQRANNDYDPYTRKPRK